MNLLSTTGKYLGIAAICGMLLVLFTSRTFAQASMPADSKEIATDKVDLGTPDYMKFSGSYPTARLPTEQPEILWKYSSTVPLSGVVAANGVVYFANEEGRVTALRANDGAAVWTHEHGSRITTQPSVDKDQIYVTSEKGIVALRRELGGLKWEYSIELGAGETMPLPIGDRVFTSGYDGNSYALHRDTGAVVWKAGFLSDAPPDPPEFDGKRARFQKILARPRGAACDGKIFVQCVFDQCRVIAMECAGGKRLWSFGTGGWTDGVPTIVGDKVYITSQDKNLYCLDHDSGRLLWTFETKSWISSQAAVENEIVFLPHHRGRLYQISAKTGKQLKLFEAEDPVDRESLVGSCPMISKGVVYFATVKGQVYAVDIDSGKVKWKLRPSPGAELGMAATDGNRIFVTCHKTIEKAGEYSVVALGTKK